RNPKHETNSNHQIRMTTVSPVFSSFRNSVICACFGFRASCFVILELLSVVCAAAMLTLVCAGPLAAQEKKLRRTYPPELPGSVVETYKTVGDTKLKLYIYYPE